MSNISNRAQKTPASPIRSLVTYANDAEKRGVKVLKLNIGQPDIHSPDEFLDGVRRFDDKVVAYDATNGNAKLLTEWCSLLNKNYAIDVSPTNMIITAGSSEALTFAFSICCDVNDEILVFEPSYANYTGFAAIAGVNLVPVQCSFEGGFHLPPKSEIEKHITKKTKVVLVCNPNNPTGTVLTTDELTMLIDVCDTHNLFLMVDEVYREFVYGERQPQCIFQVAPKHEKLIVIDSISKRYSLCGARIGCLVSFNSEVLKSASSLASTRVSAPTIEQEATAHMLRYLSHRYLIDVVGEYRNRRDAIIAELRAIPGVRVNDAEGGFYVLAQLPVADAEDFCKFLLRDFSHNNETVFLAPASGFYITPHSGVQSVRIAFVLSCAECRRAIDIVRRALEVYTVLKQSGVQ